MITFLFVFIEMFVNNILLRPWTYYEQYSELKTNDKYILNLRTFASILFHAGAILLKPKVGEPKKYFNAFQRPEPKEVFYSNNLKNNLFK